MEKLEKRLRARDFAPVRAALLLLGLLIAFSVQLLRTSEGAMLWIYSHISRPYHAFMSRLCSHFSFSAAEVFYAVLIIGLLAYLAFVIVRLIRRGGRLLQLFRCVITLGMAAALFWAGLCVLWTPYYSAPSFSEQSGVDDGPVAVSELAAVTRYFAALANEYAEAVPRTEDGSWDYDRRDILERAPEVFDAAAETFPCLEGEDLVPKGIYFSTIMSYLDFTGFFFPFTGEANVNMASPVFLLPSTAEHEIAHQRGVAAEQECNFVAIFACLESEYADYRYAGAALGYIYLGNALSGADREAWEEVYYSLSETVRRDFSENNAYWDQFEDSAVQSASNSVYDSFLKSNGQELGRQSYGKCVDLLTHYYLDAALEAAG